MDSCTLGVNQGIVRYGLYLGRQHFPSPACQSPKGHWQGLEPPSFSNLPASSS